MSAGTIDVLMITHNRPRYTRLALTRLLESCDDDMRVWLWHNGNDPETLGVVRELADHPRVHRFHHSPSNRKLREPTNWLWENADGEFVAKVDDDCLVPDGWGATLRQALLDEPELGVVACWRYYDEDYVPEYAERKLRDIRGGHRILQNCWVQGSSYLMRRRCVEELGPLRPRQSFIDYCKRVAYRGWLIGWYYPFLHEEHMDDPRSPYTDLRADDDLARDRPLTAQAFSTETIEERIRLIRAFALTCQVASADPRRYVGWRRWLIQLRWRLKGRPDPVRRLDQWGVSVE